MNLTDLPDEMVLNIFSILNPLDLFEMRKVCRYFNKLIETRLGYFNRSYHWKLKSKFTIEDIKYKIRSDILRDLEKFKVSNVIMEAVKNYNANKLQFIHNVITKYDVAPYFAITTCSELNNRELAVFLRTLKIGIIAYLCKKVARELKPGQESSLDIIEQLKRGGLMDFYACKGGLENYNTEQANKIIALSKAGVNNHNCFKMIDVLEKVNYFEGSV